MDITLEIEVNACFPLLSLDKVALKQDAYTLPDPVSVWPGGVDDMSSYISGAMELSSLSDTSYWQLPTAKDFKKASCNTPFSVYIRTKTEELTSEYATAMPELECSASEWSHMFDYEFHNACPFKWKDKKIWHCMGRFNEDGMLQFAFMHTLPTEDKGCTQYSLGDGDCNFMNKDIEGTTLMLADQDVAKSFMLDSRGKLKKALNPVLLGVISNEQPVTCIENANSTINGITTFFNDKVNVQRELIPKLFASDWSVAGGDTMTWEEVHIVTNPAIQQVATTSMLGFIYTIWGTIYRNVLYMCALKLPVPGTGSYLVKGTFEGATAWYRLQTAAGDLITDINPNMPGDTKDQPAITAADLCVVDGIDKTETLKALENLGLIQEGSEQQVDEEGHVYFYPVTYTNFNVEKFLEWYGSDEDVEDTITLATVNPESGYDDGMKLNWQGDILMNTSLTGDAGYFNCLVSPSTIEEEAKYQDLALSYYSPKTVMYKYCALAGEPDIEIDAMNMLLFTYSGLFPVGDPAGELTEIADGAMTAVGYLCTGTKKPEYLTGGFFKNPSIPCLMGANEFCCGSVDCSEAYNDGSKQQQQCGGPFAKYQIGNHKVECDDYIFDCNGNFVYCGNLASTATTIETKWDQPGLMHASPACSANVDTQPNKTPQQKYMVGSRPSMVGGSIMGGVNYICGSVKKIGAAYKILFYQGQAYNGWNSFYAKLGQDMTGVVASEYDPTVRGDLAAGAPELANGKTEAMLYNDFAYELQEPPVYRWDKAIVGFYPTDALTYSTGEGDGNGVNVYIHSLDECDRPDIYRIEVTGSAMKYLYDQVSLAPDPKGLHMHAYSYGFIRRLGNGTAPQSMGYYNVTSMHMEGYWELRTDPLLINRDIKMAFKDDRRTDRDWLPADIAIHHHIMSGITSLTETIHIDDFEDQEFFVSAKAKTFKGVCSCFGLKINDELNPAKTFNLRYKNKSGRLIPVTSACWYYIHLNPIEFARTMQLYNEVVRTEMKVRPMGETSEVSVTTPYLSWAVSLTSDVLYNLNNAGGIMRYSEGTLKMTENGNPVFYLHDSLCTPTETYFTAFVNRENKFLHHTNFDFWLYDTYTETEVKDYVKLKTNIEIPEFDMYNPTFEIPVSLVTSLENNG